MSAYARGLTNCSIGQLNADGTVTPFTSQSRAGMRYLVRVDSADRVWLDYQDGQARESALGYREVLQRTRNGMWREVSTALASEFGPARLQATELELELEPEPERHP